MQLFWIHFRRCLWINYDVIWHLIIIAPSEINSSNYADQSPDRFWCQISFHVGLLMSDLEFQLSNPILLSSLSSKICPSSWQPDFVCQQKEKPWSGDLENQPTVRDLHFKHTIMGLFIHRLHGENGVWICHYYSLFFQIKQLLLVLQICLNAENKKFYEVKKCLL